MYHRVVYDPKHIVRHYLKTWFFFDLLAQMPVDTILRAVDGTFDCSLKAGGCATSSSTQPSLFRLFKLLRLARLVKLLRLIRVTRLFERYQDDLFKFIPLLSIAKLFVGLIFIGHVVGSFFYFFSQPEWMSETEIEMFVSGSPPSPPGSSRRLMDVVTSTDTGVVTQASLIKSAYRENWIQRQRLDSPGARAVGGVEGRARG